MAAGRGRLNKALIVLLASAGVLMTSLPAGAFHGAPYMARGEVCAPGGVVCTPATLQWSGAVGSGGNVQIVVHEPVKGMSLVRLTIPGWESFGNLGFGPAVHCNLAEHTQNYALGDAPTAGKTFRVGGGMELCFDGINAGLRFCDLDGTFLAVFEMRFTCDTPRA